jgi:hypothetical protein
LQLGLGGEIVVLSAVSTDPGAAFFTIGVLGASRSWLAWRLARRSWIFYLLRFAGKTRVALFSLKILARVTS